MAILGAALIPIAEMQGQLTRQYQSQRDARAHILDQRNALSLLDSVNVMVEPKGSRLLQDGKVMRWSSLPRTRITRSLRFLGGEGDHDVALYNVEVVVTADGQDELNFHVERLGWKRVTE